MTNVEITYRVTVQTPYGQEIVSVTADDLEAIKAATDEYGFSIVGDVRVDVAVPVQRAMREIADRVNDRRELDQERNME